MTSIFNQNSYEEPKLTQNESSRQNIRSLKNYTHRKSKSNFKSLGSKIKINKKKEKEEDVEYLDSPPDIKKSAERVNRYDETPEPVESRSKS